MERLIIEFPEQLIQAIKLVENVKLKIKNPCNVVISGMGGSGIAGDFARDYADYNKANIPVIVNKSDNVFNFINETILFIASSYSGNTQETIQCLKVAINKKSQVVGITSGGEIEKICKEHDFPVLALPKGYPPRQAFAFSLISILHTLSQSDIISLKWQDEIKIASTLLNSNQKEIRLFAKETAQKIYNTFPIIYSVNNEAPALRMRQQLNENSKILCSHHVIPEMNHNEIVGWKKMNAQHSVVIFQTEYGKKMHPKRLEFCLNLFKSLNIPVIEIHAKGETLLTQWLYLVHTIDWISYELSTLNNVDPLEVKIIEELKKYLGQ